ncbi:hypothetical protein A5784_24140 [Mycobacterium sp. 852013-50091_SCH5140682]|uniref:winged helix-turn-helix domain-containing protein n=1 Tax=Mycobacterium sp. 852013-50091_SCH5140682 TaxID=1834109 RepID=UPI0007E98C28|nr:winged helix-turn-helix domain-containing protein [Mycobacterium sp. 852013-50091_SCH5140682]OBC17477.1 hypothetical protein A5784_24140 [Mycobacterium sp. 852013-50091_SCH5140682]
MPDVNTTPRVLVIDDAGGWVLGILAELRRHRMPVLVVPDGCDPWDITHRFQPRVIILSTSAREGAAWRICDADVIEVNSDSPTDATLTGADIVTLAWQPDDLGDPAGASGSGGRHTFGRQVFGPLHIDTVRRHVSVADVEIRLTRIQFDILVALARRAGEVVSRHELMTEVWGPQRTGSPGLLDVHIGKLRKRLGDNPTRPMLILTVRGRGFRLAPEGWR